MAPVFQTLFRRVWFKTRKEGSGIVRLRHGRLPRIGTHVPRDDLGSRSRAGVTAYGGLLRHAGRRYEKWKEWTGKPWWVLLGRSGRRFGV